jgi:hypothetical protein
MPVAERVQGLTTGIDGKFVKVARAARACHGLSSSRGVVRLYLRRGLEVFVNRWSTRSAARGIRRPS